MPIVYRVEISTYAGVPKSFAVIESPEITYDYLTLESTSVVCRIVDAIAGDRATIKDSDNRIVYEGFVDNVVIGEDTMTLYIAPISSIFNFGNSNFAFPSTQELRRLDEALYLAYSFMSEELLGLTIGFNYVLGGSETPVRIPSTRDLFMNVWDFYKYLFNEYGVSIATRFGTGSTDADIMCDVYVNIDTLNIDIDQSYILKREINENHSKAYNVIQVINSKEEDDMEKYLTHHYYYLKNDGTIGHAIGSEMSHITDRPFPVVLGSTSIDCELSDFDVVAMAKASEILTCTKYANEIKITISNDNRLVDVDMPYGTPVRLHHVGVVYDSVLTGKISENDATTLIFGLERSELTKQIELSNPSSNLATSGGGGVGGVIDVQIDNESIVDENKIAKIQSSEFMQHYTPNEDTIIGTYNGKTLYKRIIAWSSGSVVATGTLIATIGAIDEVVDISFTMTPSNKSNFWTGSVRDGSYYHQGVQVTRATGQVRVYYQDGWSSGTMVKVTLTYTKPDATTMSLNSVGEWI